MTTESNTLHTNGLNFQGSGTYKIRILGTVAQDWFDWLGDMSCSTSESSEGKVVTTLLGEFRDQAALLGLLNTLYDLHLSLLQVEYVNRAQLGEKSLSGNSAQA